MTTPHTAVAAKPTSMIPPLAPIDSQAKPKHEKKQAEANKGDVPPALILAGLDRNGKAHASWFAADEAKAATAAAAESGYSALPVNTEALRAIADRVPRGKIYDSGKAFVPFVAATLFHELVEQLPADLQKPRDTRRPKHLTTPMMNLVNRCKPADDREKAHLGSMWLAYSPDDESWFESVIVDKEDDGTCVLTFRDYLEDPLIRRMPDELALLPPVLPGDAE